MYYIIRRCQTKIRRENIQHIYNEMRLHADKSQARHVA